MLVLSTSAIGPQSGWIARAIRGRQSQAGGPPRIVNCKLTMPCCGQGLIVGLIPAIHRHILWRTQESSSPRRALSVCGHEEATAASCLAALPEIVDASLYQHANHVHEGQGKDDRLRQAPQSKRTDADMGHHEPVFGFNIGMSLFRERKQRRLILIDNNTDVPFITGDQPIISMRGDGIRPPTELCFYYPVSTRSALLLPQANE
ncbi:hypothetical protein [Bradyrhizobium sp. BR 1432]|uniref:hypothetical protein n=1 Tax=Bradyrhizobium sp. BR 1432 TaxID=3447966 RepID=UPI003EE671D9